MRAVERDASRTRERRRYATLAAIAILVVAGIALATGTGLTGWAAFFLVLRFVVVGLAASLFVLHGDPGPWTARRVFVVVGTAVVAVVVLVQPLSWLYRLDRALLVVIVLLVSIWTPLTFAGMRTALPGGLLLPIMIGVVEFGAMVSLVSVDVEALATANSNALRSLYDTGLPKGQGGMFVQGGIAVDNGRGMVVLTPFGRTLLGAVQANEPRLIALHELTPDASPTQCAIGMLSDPQLPAPGDRSYEWYLAQGLYHCARALHRDAVAERAMQVALTLPPAVPEPPLFKACEPETSMENFIVGLGPADQRAVADALRLVGTTPVSAASARVRACYAAHAPRSWGRRSSEGARPHAGAGAGWAAWSP
jgi:hypothetical protein